MPYSLNCIRYSYGQNSVCSALFLSQLYALLCMHYSYTLVCVKGGTRLFVFLIFWIFFFHFFFFLFYGKIQMKTYCLGRAGKAILISRAGHSLIGMSSYQISHWIFWASTMHDLLRAIIRIRNVRPSHVAEIFALFQTFHRFANLLIKQTISIILKSFSNEKVVKLRLLGVIF